NSFRFSVDSCWQPYSVNWDFGDGTFGSGFTVNHTFSSPGNYPVKMTLSIGNYFLAPATRNITVLSGTATITGPPVICKGSTFLNTYGASA
ncbi:UNVERIFIED_CONTAM: PKD domain-containing protein, partial [Salmonella enterica subsp. enterica serovar Weltevreden]